MTPDRRQDPREVPPGDRLDVAEDGTCRLDVAEDGSCFGALGPLEMLLRRLAVFFDDSSDAAPRQLQCQKTCFPADFDYKGHTCQIEDMWFRDSRCNALCGAGSSGLVPNLTL